jgi:hypothetical protein
MFNACWLLSRELCTKYEHKLTDEDKAEIAEMAAQRVLELQKNLKNKKARRALFAWLGYGDGEKEEG